MILLPRARRRRSRPLADVDVCSHLEKDFGSIRDQVGHWPNVVSCSRGPPSAGMSEEPTAAVLRIETRSCCRPATRPAACRFRILRDLHGVATGDWLYPDVEVASAIGGVREEPPIRRERGIGLQAAAEREPGQVALHASR